MFGSIRSRTLGIFKHESSIVPARLHQRKRHSMIFFRFRMKTGENIGSQSAIGDDTFDSCHPVQIPFTGILTVHQFQDARTTALHRQVNMFTYIRHLRNHLQRFVTHILRMGSRETNTYPRSGFGHCSEQHREGNHFSCRSLKTV